jgi:MFS family permease
MNRNRWSWKYWCQMLAIAVGSVIGGHIGARYGHSAWGSATCVLAFGALTTLILEPAPMVRATALWMLAVAFTFVAMMTSQYGWFLLTGACAFLGVSLWRQGQKIED